MRLTSIIDIGAAPIDGPPTYKPMLDAGLCTVTGFEPQQKMLEALRAKAGPNETYHPYVVADGKRHTLRVAEYAGMTSLLRIDRDAMSMFRSVSTGARIVDKYEVETVRLDDLNLSCDFLRMDVQGSEEMILDNAHKTLVSAVAIELEMSWIPIYKGQLHLGDMDRKLRALGFMPHRCVGVRNRMLAGSKYPQESQLMEGDFTYIRDLRGEMTAEQLYHLGMLAWYVFFSGDLHHYCMNKVAQMKEAA